jgi:hypothetical protein
LWNEQSWIRSRPVRDEAFAGLAFSPELVPLAQHESIAQDPGLRERILAYRLLAHLQFTTVLELRHVNPACSLIAEGRAPVRLTEEQRLDALRIYCDEGGHALFVEILSAQVEAHFGIRRAVLGRPRFDSLVEEIVEEHKGALSEPLIRLLFASVSETLVTRILRDVPRDPLVAPVVAAVIGDHADDEARHGAYFRWYFDALWATLAPGEQERAASILPRLLWTFLGPDPALDRDVLRSLGLSDAEGWAIVGSIYPKEMVSEMVCRAAAPTISLFARAGVFSSQRAIDAFAEHHLNP